MKIIVTGKNITISEKIQDAIDKRFEKLGKFFADDIQANIVIHPERDKVKMEATIVTKGTIFRAEDVSQDVFDSIDIVADKLSSQMTKYKGKLQKRNKSGESVRFEMIPEAEQAEEAKVVKTKKFELTPMTVDEAIMQMELLQHSFYIFLDRLEVTANCIISVIINGFPVIRKIRIIVVQKMRGCNNKIKSRSGKLSFCNNKS